MSQSQAKEHVVIHQSSTKEAVELQEVPLETPYSINNNDDSQDDGYKPFTVENNDENPAEDDGYTPFARNHLRSDDDPNEEGNKIASEAPKDAQKSDPLGCFGRYLTVWVGLCMITGTLIGYYAPGVTAALNRGTVAQVSIPIAILIWIMIFPMTLKINFAALRNVHRNYKALAVTCFVNWLIQPFLMYGLATGFFRIPGLFDEQTADEYVAGACILGGSPCTAMVFVWSSLVDGDAAYTLVQVAVNDALIFILYVPTLFLLLGIDGIEVPYATVALSVLVFLLIPFMLGGLTRWFYMRYYDEAALSKLEGKFSGFTILALLTTLVLIFIYQGETLAKNWVDILLISIPLTIQIYLVFIIAYGLMWWLKVPFRTAAPGFFIAASNFFELAVAVAIASYGTDSGATLVTIVGVLVEVPIMLSLVKIAKMTKSRIDRRANSNSDPRAEGMRQPLTSYDSSNSDPRAEGMVDRVDTAVAVEKGSLNLQQLLTPQAVVDGVDTAVLVDNGILNL
eukprot:g7585.t1